MTEQGKRWGGSWWRLARPMAGVMLVMAITACGGGSGGGGGDAATPPVATTNQGRFIDAPVQGLSYRTRSTSGITDASGRFDYVTTGEDITFSIGGLVIGRASASSDVHVYELETTAQEASAGRNARVAQLLQSLDTNRGTGQSIVIDPVVAARIPVTAARMALTPPCAACWVPWAWAVSSCPTPLRDSGQMPSWLALWCPAR